MGFAAAAAAALALVGGGDAARAPGGARAGQAPVGVRTRTPALPPPLSAAGPPVPSPQPILSAPPLAEVRLAD